ncbi:MAG: hypothetical protein JXR79_02385 [Nitrospirae bacterium]|nr:hypothetical protein [Nitrospirota bacterium]
MRRLILIVLLAMAFSFSINIQASKANVDMGVSIGDEGLRGFYLSVGDYFSVPEREVVFVRERRIPDEEIPVVFFLSRYARVAPQIIIDMRLRGMSWMNITLHYKLHPDIYYVPLKRNPGPPYGKAYGYYMKRPKKDWHKIRLHDRDVVNMVNLRFITEYHRYDPDYVVGARSKGRNFVVIDRDVKRDRKLKGSDDRDRGRFREPDRDRGNGSRDYKDNKWDKNNKKDRGDFRDIKPSQRNAGAPDRDKFQSRDHAKERKEGSARDNGDKFNKKDKKDNHKKD